MKWTIVALTVLMQSDLAYAKTGRIGNRQLQAEPDVSDYYYPTDITKGVCSNDPSMRPETFTEINFTLFETLEECCDHWFYWQEKGNCHRNVEITAVRDDESSVLSEPAATTVPPAASAEPAATGSTDDTSSSTAQDDSPSFFYPMDLITGKCSSDASNRPDNFDSLGFTLFFTAEECCKVWYGWQANNFCVLNTAVDSTGGSPVTSPVSPPDSQSGGDSDGDNGGDSGGDSGSDGGSSSASNFYLVDNACEVSANGVMGGNAFATQAECCTNIPDFNSRKSCCNESVDSPADQLRCLLEEAADPIEKEQFYLSNGKCYSSANGVMDGMLYESREKCCNAIVPLADRHSCLWNQSGESPNRQPGSMSAPSSATHLVWGSYTVAVMGCLWFQFM